MGDIEDNISQCTFLQMTYTAENPHADRQWPRRSTPAVVSDRPAAETPTPRPPPTTTGLREDKCPVVSKRPLHSRAELCVKRNTLCMLYVYIHHVYTHVIPSIVSDLEVSDNGDPLYEINYCR
jgi:hypothetical protein